MRPLLACLFLLSLAGLVSAESRVIAVSLDKVIQPITVETLTHAIDQAIRERADLLLIRQVGQILLDARARRLTM